MKNLFLSLLSLTVAATGFSAVADGVVRRQVAGIDCLVNRTNVKDVVIVRGTWFAGDAFAPADNPAIPTLVAGMLDKGTIRQDKFALARTLEDLGANIQFAAGDSVGAEFSVSCLREDLPVVLGLLAEQLRTPAFGEEEFAKYKKQLSAGIRRQTEDTGQVANRAFVRAAYPAGHINRLATFEEWQKGIEAATIADLKAFHAAHYGTAHLTIVAAGDVDADQLHALLEKNFSGWAGGKAAKPAGSVTGAAKGDVAMDQTVFVPGKTSANVILGQATGLRYTDPDTLPLRLGTAILGEGFTGRLTKQLREKEGLTYGISAGVADDTFSDGRWMVTSTFAPTLVEKGITSARKVVNDFLASGVTAEELAAKKTNFVGRQQVGLATTSGLAGALLTTVQRGLPVTFLDEFPAKVGAVTLEQVNTAIKKHLKADQLVLIKAGTLQP
jgi:zinc protease